ncbi:Xyloglucan O-acetyltransferase 1 [Asimina triloba]
MGAPFAPTNKDSASAHFLTKKKLFPWALYSLLSLAVLRFYFYPPLLQDNASASHPNPFTISSSTAASSVSPQEIKPKIENKSCNYWDGKWVPDRSPPAYNGTSCSTIKDGQNCMKHGRPDSGYLHWRWRPTGCNLPRFDPSTFLRLVRNMHLAFIGDSMARNQLESLLCLLSTASSPDLVYRSGEDNKFRRWRFPAHNATVSVYWSPFLVKGVEKSPSGPDHNKLYVDFVDERWASELGQMDAVLLSIGHWFLHPAVYYENDSVLGCHYCTGQNHTEIGFFDVFRKSLRTTLKAVSNFNDGKPRKVFVTTFSPSHFEGEWDKAGACPKKKPFEKGEKQMEGMDADMKNIQLEEVGVAEKYRKDSEVRFEALDVTKLSLMRPDGHPGPYMYPFPFANGVPERVQNDCVHWCLPGPIDTWNEILLEVMKRWEGEDRWRQSDGVNRTRDGIWDWGRAAATFSQHGCTGKGRAEEKSRTITLRSVGWTKTTKPSFGYSSCQSSKQQTWPSPGKEFLSSVRSSAQANSPQLWPSYEIIAGALIGHKEFGLERGSTCHNAHPTAHFTFNCQGLESASDRRIGIPIPGKERIENGVSSICFCRSCMHFSFYKNQRFPLLSSQNPNLSFHFSESSLYLSPPTRYSLSNCPLISPPPMSPLCMRPQGSCAHPSSLIPSAVCFSTLQFFIGLLFEMVDISNRAQTTYSRLQT